MLFLLLFSNGVARLDFVFVRTQQLSLFGVFYVVQFASYKPATDGTSEASEEGSKEILDIVKQQVPQSSKRGANLSMSNL